MPIQSKASKTKKTTSMALLLEQVKERHLLGVMVAEINELYQASQKESDGLSLLLGEKMQEASHLILSDGSLDAKAKTVQLGQLIIRFEDIFKEDNDKRFRKLGDVCYAIELRGGHQALAEQALIAARDAYLKPSVGNARAKL